MDEHCTCGAELPPGAQFCPRCGRPLHGAPPPDEPNPIEEALRQKEAQERPRITMGSPEVARPAFLSATIAALLGSLPVLSMLCFLWYPAAGFFTVFQFRRRTRVDATTAEGARLGWITGLFCFVITLFLSAAASLLPSAEGGFSAAMENLRRQIEQSGASEEMQQQMIELLQNPLAFGAMIAAAIVFSFVLTVGFTTVGGALGAKVLQRDE